MIIYINFRSGLLVGHPHLTYADARKACDDRADTITKMFREVSDFGKELAA